MFTISGLEIGNLSSRSHVVQALAPLVVDKTRTVAKCTKIENGRTEIAKKHFFSLFSHLKSGKL